MDNDDAIDGYNKSWTNIATIRQEVGLTQRRTQDFKKRREKKSVVRIMNTDL